jgi:ParB-like chromosome segregation protein Spo0J
MTQRKISTIKIADILLPVHGRQVSEETVRALADSISKVGLQHPIAVYRRVGLGPRYKLAAGLHRLLAFQSLNRTEILATILPKGAANIYQHAENLHRAELRLLDRYDAIVGYEKETSAEGRKSQPHDQGLSRTARDIKVDRRIVRQARAAQAITAPVKLKLIAAGLDNHAGAIAEVAGKASVEEQLQAIAEFSKSHKASPVPAKRGTVGAQPQSAAELMRRWLTSDFKKIFDSSKRLVREEFVRRAFAEATLDKAEWV